MWVSIILTCYKQEKYIEKSILSVLGQPFEDWELLIWDDSPDDKSRNIISNYTKKHPDKIHAWHHNPNKWIVNNMLFLLEKRNKESDYIIFLEWDDYLFPNYLSKKLEVFITFPNVKLVYNELTTINKKWEIISNKELKNNNAIISKQWMISYEMLLNNMYYMSRSTIMIKSELIDKYSIYKDFLWKNTIISDLFFFNQVAHNEDIYWIEEPLTYYRLHDDSVTKNIQWTVSYCFQFINYLQYLLNQWLINNKVYKDQVCRRYLIIAIRTIKEALHIWKIRTLKIFTIDFFKSINIRTKLLFNKISQNGI